MYIKEKLSVNFHGSTVEFSSTQYSDDKPNFKNAFFENNIHEALHEYCKDILTIIKNGTVLCCSILSLFSELGYGDAVILFVLKNGNNLQLFIYDPADCQSMYFNKIQFFLQLLKYCFDVNNNNDFKTCDIISQKNNSFISFGLQTMFENKVKLMVTV